MTTTPKTSKILTLSGLICLCFHFTFLFLWIHAFGLGKNQYERVEIYNSYLPTFLHDRFVNACFSISLSLLGILSCAISLARSTILFVILNIVIILFCGLFLLWNLFGLM